jgi:demethylmenaquinone methyltransferase/2-methoxy-6-polyprenyl-1,4-benzoquinol methylase
VEKSRKSPRDSSRAEQKKLFSAIASKYDFLNHLLSLNIDRRWRRRLVEYTGVRNGDDILDVCTGTGDIAVRFARADGVGCIYGIDQSEEMLRIAKRKIDSNRLGRKIRLLETNALYLPFRDDSFDVVSIGFGLRNVGKHNRSVAEMARVLKEGGRLLILEFSPPEGNLFGRVYRLYLDVVIKTLGGVISGSADAYRHLSTSIANFPRPREVIRLMEAGGLTEISSERLTGGIAYIYRGTKRRA